MSAITGEGRPGGEPRLAQPACTPEDLRAALVVLAPEAVATFDAERAEAMRQARQTVSAAPVRRFLGQWAVYVAVERFPQRAARLHHLQARAAEVTDVGEARAITAEIGRILDAAHADAGIDRPLGAA